MTCEGVRGRGKGTGLTTHTIEQSLQKGYVATGSQAKDFVVWTITKSELEGNLKFSPQVQYGQDLNAKASGGGLPSL